MSESVYQRRPWLAQYDERVPADIEREFENVLDMFSAASRRAPDQVAIKYFDGAITMSELDRASDAFAVALVEHDISPGDRVALFLQNVPQFVIAALATWKAGAIVVPVNPMYRHRELADVFADSGTTVVVCLESLYPVTRAARADTAVRQVITTADREYQSRDDARVFAGIEREHTEDALDMSELIRQHDGRQPETVHPRATDVAMLPYTSGTTGPAKGSCNTHANVVFNAQVYRDWMPVRPEDTVFGVAPLFHITGLIGHLAVALLVPVPLVLTYRFEPTLAAEAVAEHQASFTIGAITVFIAWTNTDAVTRAQLASLRSVYSGGAPIPQAAIRAFAEKFGHYIHNGYGLTETNSPSHAVPSAAEAPVDTDFGAVSVGVPVPNTVVRVLDENGQELPVGQVGEIVTEGPQVAAGYWHKPEETAHAMPGGRFHTGDVGFMDAEGWFFLVDRKKDQINAAGYKVWPREVEDVLYEHPAVREAAVVGVGDAYRGETVKAYVSLRQGVHADARELTEFCRHRLAAYKCPRHVETIEELPKTVTGKILRRQLRDDR